MPNYKLYYFPGKGRAEPARMMFKLKDVPFEDIRLGGEKWQEFKPNTPFGQMPLLEVDGVQIAQSNAICRLIAKRLGLYGKDDMEAAKIDAMIDAMGDVGNAVMAGFGKPEEEKAAIFKKFLDEKAPTMFANMEKQIEESGHCVGNELTWADIQLYNAYDFFTKHQNLALPVDNCPKMKKLLNNVETNPKIAAWIQERPQSNF